MKDPRRIIIDTDPGIDDALAIAIALKNPQLDVRLISTVAGNVPVSQTTENALKLVEFFGADVPVARGCEQPLFRVLECSTYVHGKDGMGGFEFPVPVSKPIEKHSIIAMRDEIMSTDEKTTIVAIGIETNVAILLKMYPEVKERIEEIVIMGGSMIGGNVTSSAEFNFYNDPHAAEIVFRSGVPITMLGLDVTNYGRLYTGTNEKLKKSGREGQMLSAILEKYVAGTLETGLPVHDVCTVAYLLKPELFETDMKHVMVQTEGPAAGATVFHRRPEMVEGEPNVKVCTGVDEPAFEEWVVSQLCGEC